MSLPPLPEHIKQANAALSAASNKSMDIAKKCAASRKAEMNLPPLPRPMMNQHLYTARETKAYGQACREQALEEAAHLCESEYDNWDNERPLRICATAIRSLK